MEDDYWFRNGSEGNVDKRARPAFETRPISRLPFVSGHPSAIAALVPGFILVGPLYDLMTRRRVHRAYLVGLPAVVAILPPVVTGLSGTGAWRALAASLGVS